MKSLKSAFFTTGIIGTVLICCTATQNVEGNTGGPLPPPVNIEFTVVNTPQAGEETMLKVIVTPLEDMHADISCVLPEGVRLVMEEGLMLHPYMDRHLYNEQEFPLHREAIGLWVGPLAGGESKEFAFRVVISDRGSYGFLAIVEALSKWGIKKEVLVIDIK
jgi:hypothetical protein